MYLKPKQVFMKPTQSQLNQLAKDWNNLENKAVFEFNQEQVSIPKLIPTLKKYFLTSYSD